MTMIDKIRAEIERRIEAIANAPSDNGVMDSINGAKGHELMTLLSFLDTLEEPVSDCHDLEGAAETHVKNKYCLTKLLGTEIQEAVNDFIAGAEWQKEEFEKNRLAACDSLTKEEYDREMDFTTEFIEEHHRTPTFSDAIEYGMRLQREQMMEGAVAVEVVGEKRDLRLIDSTQRCLFDAKRGDWLKIIIVKEDEQ